MNTHPHSHTNDPSTSYRAGDKAHQDGTVTRHEDRIVSALGKSLVPLTAVEIGLECNLDQVQVARRMRRLVDTEQIEVVGTTGRMQTYRVKEAR